MFLVGDFNSWNQEICKCERLANDIFEVFVPDDAMYEVMIKLLIKSLVSCPIVHLSKVKILILHKTEEGEIKKLFRVPSHIHYAIPDPLC